MDDYQSTVKNYGLAIILFTLISKINLLPLSIRVHCTGLKIVRMIRKINRLQMNHFGDRDAIAEKQDNISWSACSSVSIPDTAIRKRNTGELPGIPQEQ